MKKILVLGASGMAGHTISLYFKKQNYDVTTLTTSPFFIKPNIVLDAFDYLKLKEVVLEGQYDAVINCIGLLNEFANNNPDKAIYLNGFLPHYLSQITKNTKTKIIQMSTDCVFSGEKGSYSEYDFKDGKTMYDQSKAIGELNNSKDLTFRNSIIGPDINPNGIGLFNWFIKQTGDLKGYRKAIWTGVTTLTLAKAMEKAIIDNLTGIYNLVNNETISKYELLKIFNDIFKKGNLKITPDDQVALNKSLMRTRKDFEFVVPSYKDMILEMAEWIKENIEIYPHYKEMIQWKN